MILSYVNFTSIVQNPDGSWTFSWHFQTGGTSYRVVLWGITQAFVPNMVGTVSYTWSSSDTSFLDYPPPLEVILIPNVVVTNSQLVLSEQYFPYLTMQWYGVPTASTYSVQQQQADLSFADIVTPISETGQWIYSVTTNLLLDETTYVYQVEQTDNYGNVSVPLDFVDYNVCPPFPPDGQITVNYLKPNIVINAVT